MLGAGRVAGRAAIRPGLLAVVATVVTRGSLAFSTPANAALAISVNLALEVIRAERAAQAAAINAGLVVVLYSVAVSRESTFPAHAHSVDAVCRFLAALRMEARMTRAATIDAGLERRIDHSVYLLCADHRDAVE
jgi:hypothetical protein